MSENPPMEHARYAFLVDTYRTERLKTLGVWAQIPDDRLRVRSEPRARSPLEHLVHQCQSEHNWMDGILGIHIERAALPGEETRAAFIEHYAACSADRLVRLAAQPESWFEEEAVFFDVPRTRAWILTRRFTHTAHHRGQLLAALRAWGVSLYSTYGPTADTGGLPANGGRVIYRGDSVAPALPGPGAAAPTERPERR
jgi:uncharacterized damage-inducible protein DinB